MSEFIGRGAPLSEDGFQAALDKLTVDPEALWAVLSVETSGCGYQPDRRPKILFERHYFHRLTGGRFDGGHPDISAPSSGGYGHSGAHQYERLAEALSLDRRAALMSASWGLGQVMGEHYADLGYSDVDEMVADFVKGEDQQLAAMADFIDRSPMKAALRSRDWKSFAHRYNGADYAKNNYDGNLSLYCSHYTARGCPDLQVRQAQVYLNYLGYDRGGIDGLVGQHTTDALRDFQSKHGIDPVDGTITSITLEALANA